MVVSVWSTSYKKLTLFAFYNTPDRHTWVKSKHIAAKPHKMCPCIENMTRSTTKIWFVNDFAFKCFVMTPLSFFFKLQSRFWRFLGQCLSFKNFESQKNFARLAPQGSDRKLRAKRFVANFRSNKLEIDEQGFVKFVFKWLGKFKFSHELVDIVWKISLSW